MDKSGTIAKKVVKCPQLTMSKRILGFVMKSKAASKEGAGPISHSLDMRKINIPEIIIEYTKIIRYKLKAFIIGKIKLRIAPVR